MKTSEERSVSTNQLVSRLLSGKGTSHNENLKLE